MNVIRMELAYNPFRFMNKIYWLFLCVALCSCKKEELLLNQKQGAKEITAFVFEEIGKYGGPSISSTNKIGNGVTDYVYSEDKQGFQVICFGNKMADFQKIFQPDFGIPAMAKTNAVGLSSFVYGSPKMPVVINCSLDWGMVNGTQREFTHLVVAKAGALN